ncbi:MAG: hypothetical protein RR712_02400 [Terrisporobacter sp.]
MKNKTIIGLTTVAILCTSSIAFANDIKIIKKDSIEYIPLKKVIQKAGGKIEISNDKAQIVIGGKNVTIEKNSSFVKIDEKYYPLDKKEVNGFEIPINTKPLYEGNEIYIEKDFLKENKLVNYKIEKDSVIVNTQTESKSQNNSEETTKKEEPKKDKEDTKENNIEKPENTEKPSKPETPIKPPTKPTKPTKPPIKPPKPPTKPDNNGGSGNTGGNTGSGDNNSGSGNTGGNTGSGDNNSGNGNTGGDTGSGDNSGNTGGNTGGDSSGGTTTPENPSPEPITNN